MAFVQAHMGWILGAGVPALLFVAATVANMFRDPDHDPLTPPPRWVQFVDAICALAGFVAPKGYSGLWGRFSPPGHMPQRLPDEDITPTAPTKAPPPIPAWLLVPFVFTFIAGCANWQTNLYKGIATAQISSDGCREALDKTTEAKWSQVHVLAKEDKQGAQKILDDWKALRGKIALSCEAAGLAAKQANALAPTLTSKNAGEWIGKLIAAAADISKLLGEHGIKLPGGL